ncbi:MAG: outer membrane protein assembly factor BamA [Roseibium album]|uniref:outer membrane protein assembly factor BamA n=1 Tax=Roseibium album TaxID=311410 RepID=UPI0018CABE09|nr:outer membrane protein assembly factor BamA [Roseibium album]MBG6158546.1 outer membrane protein insertion porin family [Labrenzia sp. EL_162]MBG6165910.1 outer membrane protein insertion porin family [Labrenzia sp. EL_195]MBG6178514.1 outer membrane protein insertion porin family [Labrenzia sp. EL_132]MBG6196441.1 outer membrane protein insertion porin family [Labrenzia sp. EL_159]MBG6202487.1 outer membrane protein insertion porin family [Labrenzia sp. EL_13]MBG6233137.1 outer membrane p
MQRLQKLTRAVFLAAAVFSIGSVLPQFVGQLSFVNVAEAAVARSIQVQGNTRIEDETVISYMTIVPGRSYSAFDIDESLKALYATGLFATVDITPRGSTVIVTVSENPIINRVSFEGNRKIKDNALETAIRSQPRSTLSRAKVQADVQNILESYRRSGRFGASVEPQIIDRGQNRVDLVFEINEGSKTGVERISFIGNSAFSDGRLRDVIRTRESGLLSFLRSTDTYDPDRLAADEELLRQYYNKKGYADFRIVSVSADLDREQNIFYVTFTVDEGEKYKIGEVELVSTIAEVDPEDLRKLVRTRSGQTFNSLRVEQSVEDITLRVSEEGYAFARVRPRGARNYDDNTISLIYYIEEGPRAYIERINIIGNDRTREYVIRREFDIVEGDAFNRALVDKAERRLRNLGFFENISITTQQGSAPDRVVVNVRVEEKPTGEISFGVGYSTVDGIIGDVSLTEKNFLGRGQFVKLSIGGGTDTQSYEFRFVEPFFMGRRVALDLDVYRRVDDANDYRSFDQKRTGGGFGFTLPLREEELSLRLFYSIFQEENSDPDNQSTSINNCNTSNLSLAVCDSLGTYLTSLVGYDLRYNTLDRNIDPSDGIFASFGQEFAGVGGDSYYIKTEAQARAYKEILADYGLVGSLQLRGGNIMAIGDERLRVSEQFMLGGNLVRGFENQGIGPRDASTDDAIGGRFYFAATAEGTFPFPVLPKEFGLSGAVFADAGSLWNADSDLVGLVENNGGTIDSDDFSVRASVGAGIRWRSPFGPIRADFAYPLVKEDSDKTQLFRLSGGTRF